MNTILVTGSLLAVYLIWGSTYLAMKIAVHSSPPYLMSGIRFFIAGIIFYLILKIRKTDNPSLRQWLNSILVGLLFFAGGTGLVGYAQCWVNSSAASMAVAIIPIWICLFSIILKEYPGRREILGVGIGFLGIVVLNLSAQMHVEPTGGLLLFFSPLLWSIGTILTRHLDLPAGAMRSAAQLLGGGAMCLLISFLIREPFVLPDTAGVWSVIYLIIFGSLIAFTAYNYLLSNASPVLATSYAFVNPIVAALLGVATGESWSHKLTIALLLICLGVIFVILGQNERKAAKPK